MAVDTPPNLRYRPHPSWRYCTPRFAVKTPSVLRYLPTAYREMAGSASPWPLRDFTQYPRLPNLHSVHTSNCGNEWPHRMTGWLEWAGCQAEWVDRVSPGNLPAVLPRSFLPALGPSSIALSLRRRGNG